MESTVRRMTCGVRALNTIPWREKVQLIVRFLRGSIHYFVVALLCACLGMVFNLSLIHI